MDILPLDSCFLDFEFSSDLGVTYLQEDKVYQLASDVIPKIFMIESFLNSLSNVSKVCVINQLENAEIGSKEKFSSVAKSFSQASLVKTNEVFRQAHYLANAQGFFEPILEKAIEFADEEAFYGRKIEQASVLAYFFENIEYDKYQEALIFLKEKRVNMSSALKGFLVSEAVPKIGYSLDKPVFSSIASLFFSQGAKLDEMYKGQVSVLEMLLMFCQDALALQMFSELLHLCDDVKALKFSSFGVDYNLKEYIVRLSGDLEGEDLENNPIFEIINSYDLEERYVLPKGKYPWAGFVFLEVYAALLENNPEHLKTAIENHGVNLNAQYIGLKKPIGLDFWGENGELKQKEVVISLEMFEAFLKHKLIILDDDLRACCNFDGGTVAEEILVQTKNFDYLKLLAKYGYDFTKKIRTGWYPEMKEFLIIDVLRNYIKGDLSRVDEKVYNFIKFLVDNMYVDLEKKYSVTELDDNDKPIVFRKTLQEVFKEFFQSYSYRENQQETYVSQIIDLLRP